MEYLNNSLIDGENVVYETALHWSRYMTWVLTIVLGLTVAPVGVGAVMVLFGLAGCAFSMVDGRTSVFAVTDKRILLKRGIIRRHTAEVLLHKVEGIQADQGIFGRILGYGTIVPGGSGGTKQAFKGVSKPMEFRKRVNEQVDVLAQQMAPAALAAAETRLPK